MLIACSDLWANAARVLLQQLYRRYTVCRLTEAAVRKVINKGLLNWAGLREAVWGWAGRLWARQSAGRWKPWKPPDSQRTFCPNWSVRLLDFHPHNCDRPLQPFHCFPRRRWCSSTSVYGSPQFPIIFWKEFIGGIIACNLVLIIGGKETVSSWYTCNFS